MRTSKRGWIAGVLAISTSVWAEPQEGFQNIPLIVSATSTQALVVTVASDNQTFWLSECALSPNNNETPSTVVAQVNNFANCRRITQEHFMKTSSVSIYKIDLAFAFFLRAGFETAHEKLQMKGAMTGVSWLILLILSHVTRNNYLAWASLPVGLSYVGFNGLALQQGIRGRSLRGQVFSPLHTAFSKNLDELEVLREDATWDRWLIPGLYFLYKEALLTAFQQVGLDPATQIQPK